MMTNAGFKLAGMSRQPKIISEFDVRLGAVVKSKRVKASETRASMSVKTGIPEANLKRREQGDNEITVSELERIGRVVGVPPAEMVEEALKDYGGLEKLLAEHVARQPAPVTAEDNVTYIGPQVPPLAAAAKKKKDEDR